MIDFEKAAADVAAALKNGSGQHAQESYDQATGWSVQARNVTEKSSFVVKQDGIPIKVYVHPFKAA
ncbi:MAG: hypothetical protein K9G62_07650 [Alphaproteobacteria bacterium]|nr:hypothetical protein [Alphaproteobacteria bacterium]